MNTQFKTLTLFALASTTFIPTGAKADIINTGESFISTENAWVFETGERNNTSNIPIPTVFPDSLQERRALPVNRQVLAPDSVNLSANDSYIVNEVENQTSLTVTDYNLNVTVDLAQVRGSHGFAEGVELTSSDGSTDQSFIRGEVVRFDSDGNKLDRSSSVSGTFGRGESVDVAFRNIRKNRGPIRESGVHFDSEGVLIVEDLQNGGDLDFNDGEYLENLSAIGIAQVEGTVSETSQTVEKEEYELESRSAIDLLGFMNSTGEYTDTTRFYAESDGTLGVTYQSKPLFNNRFPTLFNVGARTNFESGVLSTGLNQFLTPAYRIEQSEQLSDSIVLFPPEIEAGNGDAAYNNVGGVLIEKSNGDIYFLVQWTVNDKYEQETYFSAEEVFSFSSALVPEQEGTSELVSGQTYKVEFNEELGIYTIGNIRIISQNIQPQNFYSVTDTLLGVEDTFPDSNYSVDGFDGTRILGTVDYNDAFNSLQYDRPIETVETIVPNRFGIYVGSSVELGFGETEKTVTTTQTDITTSGEAYLSVDSQGLVTVEGLEAEETVNTFVSDISRSSEVESDTGYEVAAGFVYNYDENPWSEGSGQIGVEIYTGSESGVVTEWRDSIVGLPVYARADFEFEGETEVVAGISLSF